MGTLTHAGQRYELEDRLLAHLKIVITAKLQHHEAFLLNWAIPASQGSGRVTLWLAPQTPIEYRFAGSRVPDLNRQWIDALSRASHGLLGLTVMSEEEAMAATQRRPLAARP